MILKIKLLLNPQTFWPKPMEKSRCLQAKFYWPSLCFRGKCKHSPGRLRFVIFELYIHTYLYDGYVFMYIAFLKYVSSYNISSRQNNVVIRMNNGLWDMVGEHFVSIVFTFIFFHFSCWYFAILVLIGHNIKCVDFVCWKNNLGVVKVCKDKLSEIWMGVENELNLTMAWFTRYDKLLNKKKHVT